jgi:hypothetical protein
MKPNIYHTIVADYQKLPRYKYNLSQINYMPLET